MHEQCKEVKRFNTVGYYMWGGKPMASKDYLEIPIKQSDKPFRIRSEEAKALLEQLGSGRARQFKKKFGRDYVDCPHKGKQVPFLLCFTCPGFVRRVKGVVHCRGLPEDKN